MIKFHIIKKLQIFYQTLILKSNFNKRLHRSFHRVVRKGQGILQTEKLIIPQTTTITTHRSTKLPEANTATHAPPPSQSIQNLHLYTLPGGSDFL